VGERVKELGRGSANGNIVVEGAGKLGEFGRRNWVRGKTARGQKGLESARHGLKGGGGEIERLSRN
jgi:hypothetical protein